jgi:ferredoxin
MNFDECNGCSLCVMGCEGFKQSGNESVTAQGRNMLLRVSEDLENLKENLSHCVQSGYCTAVCPRGVKNDVIFSYLMKKNDNSDKEVFLKNWEAAQNLYGKELKLDGLEGNTVLGGDRFLLQLGCSFFNEHGHRLPLLKKMCEKYELPFYVKEEEKCCGHFLGQRGLRQTGRAEEAVHLDASCAHRGDMSFWDFLFQKKIESLKGQSLFVSARWLNAQSTKRNKLLEKLVKETGLKLVNRDGLFLATGGSQSSWRSRLGLELPLKNEIPKDALVMEVSEIGPDNPWLLELC